MGLMRRVTNLVRRSQMDREIGEELRAHIEMRTDENVARGMSPQAARREALIQFGNAAAMRERVAGADASRGVDNLLRDVRYALRRLRHSPGFALTAIVTLALGIGANVIVFGIVNALLLRPLNVAAPDRLFEMVNHQAGDDNQSYPDYLDYRARNKTFSDMAAYRINFAGLSSEGTAQRAWDTEVSSNYFDMLGVQPQLGRVFHASDEHGENSMPYVVLSDGFWRTRFNADPAVVGTTVELNKQPFTVIGVAPKGFNGTESFFWPEFWMPIVNERQTEGYDFVHNRSSHGLFVLGSLKPGITAAQANDDLNAIAKQLAHDYPATNDGSGMRLVKPGFMGDLAGPVRMFLFATLALAMLVLLAACMNLAGICTARAADRSRELAIRLSIGSTRGRIVRQLLTEAVVVALLGGAAGTALSVGMLRLLTMWQPIAALPIHVTVTPDARTFAVALLLALASGILPGLLPARQVWRTDAMQAMKSGATAAGKGMRLNLRDLLLGVQIAVCALLVTCSLVALRGMQRTLHAPIGFEPENATLVQMDMKMANYTDDAAFPLQQRMLEEAARLPGVTAVGTADNTPLSESGDSWTVYRENATEYKPSTQAFSARAFIVSPGYFGAAQTRLIEGRDFTWADGPKAPAVAIVNRTFARRLFGNGPAVGQRYRGGDKTLYTIVGVVEDGKYEFLTEDAEPAEFVALTQNHERETTLVVRSTLPPSQMAGALNGLVHGMDSSLPVTIGPWEQSLALVMFPARAATIALGTMGLLAALLAITGVFGMAAYTVSKRMRELGIRMALGARRVQVMKAALARPLVLLMAGSAAGLALGVAASRVLAALVYSATIRDPLVLAGAVLSMMLIGVAATAIPARKAMGIEPARLLRED
jgi:predicted permease